MAKKRSMYSMHHQVATLSQFGRAMPFCIAEVAPGDTWSGKVGALLRLSPLKHAVLQDIHVDMFMFYVPHRLVWADWEDFIAEGPMTTPTYSVPFVSIAAGNTSYESLFWRANAGVKTTFYHAFRLYAYNLIWNEYFRDEQEAIAVPTSTPGIWGQSISYKKDYWTVLRDQIGTAQNLHYFDTNVGSGTQASAVDVLEAIARQKIAMKRETYGTRYIDILRSYGINVNYQMLQRPEVVAIARNTVNITDVVATDSANLGDLAGHGISGSRLTLNRKSFPEHGTLMGICVVRPPLTDPGLVDWFDTVVDYEDYYDPGLVPLPPVAVRKFKVKPSMDAANENDIVGYQQWGNWYRSLPSRVHVGLEEWVGNRSLVDVDFSADDLRTVEPNNFNSMFSDTTFGHFQGSFVNNLRALRYLPKQNTAVVTGMSG